MDGAMHLLHPFSGLTASTLTIVVYSRICGGALQVLCKAQKGRDARARAAARTARGESRDARASQKRRASPPAARARRHTLFTRAGPFIP